MPNKFTYSIVILSICLVIIFSVILSIKFSLKFKDRKINPLVSIPAKLMAFNLNH